MLGKNTILVWRVLYRHGTLLTECGHLFIQTCKCTADILHAKLIGEETNEVQMNSKSLKAINIISCECLVVNQINTVKLLVIQHFSIYMAFIVTVDSILDHHQRSSPKYCTTGKNVQPYYTLKCSIRPYNNFIAHKNKTLLVNPGSLCALVCLSMIYINEMSVSDNSIRFVMLPYYY